MLDIKFILENREIVEKAIADKQTEPVDLDRIATLYEERKELRAKIDEMNAARNKAAKEQNHAEGKRLKEEAGAIEEKLPIVEKELVTLASKVPNVPSADTPIGADESANVVLRSWGEPRKFDFEPKAHWDLGDRKSVV